MLLPLIGGIVFQYNTDLSTGISCCSILLALTGLYIFSYVRTRIQFKWYWISGILIQARFLWHGFNIAELS
jgi:hypothetical protein